MAGAEESFSFKEYLAFLQMCDQRLPDISEILNKFNQSQRIGFINKLFKWQPPVVNPIERPQKSSALSKKFAEEAIRAANERRYEESLKWAYKVTAFAEHDGDLALGHFIRFQILSVGELGSIPRYTLEAKRALECSKPPTKVSVVFKNKPSYVDVFPTKFNREVLMQVANYWEGYWETKTAKTIEEEHRKVEDEDARLEFVKDRFTLKTPNPKIPAVENFVEMRFDSVRGRHLVVTEDVSVGTTLLVEKPFARVNGTLFPEIQKCHHCFKKDFVPTPCQNCVFVLFCSEECKKAADSYHQYECPCFGDLLQILSNPNDLPKWLLALKVVCAQGPERMLQHYQEEVKNVGKVSAVSLKAPENGIPGFDPKTGIYDPESFYTIRHLAVHSKFSIDHAATALAISRILQARSKFFDTVKTRVRMSPASGSKSGSGDFKKLDDTFQQEFQNYIAEALAQVSNSFLFHWGSGKDEIARDRAIHATANLFSHSCDSNSFATSDRTLGVAVVAARDLSAGEEIVESYAHNYLNDDKVSRVEKLRSGSTNGFVCDCPACLNDWPLKKILEDKKDQPNFCCSKCYQSNLFINTRTKSPEEFRKIALNSENNYTCGQCKEVQSAEILGKQFERHVKGLEICLKIMNEKGKGAILGTLPAVKRALQFFQWNLIPPSFYQYKSQRIFNEVSVAVTVKEDTARFY